MQDPISTVSRFIARPHLAEYHLSPEESALLQRKQQVYSRLIADFPLEAAKEAAYLYESRGEDNTLTYGEADFLSLGEVFESIKHRHGGFKASGVFYDLGSVSSS